MFGELAEIVDANVHGDPDASVSGIATLELAGPKDLSFFSNRKYYKFLTETKASIVILHPDDLKQCPTNALTVDDPYLAYAKIATWLSRPLIGRQTIQPTTRGRSTPANH